MPYVNSQGVRIHYQVEGEGPPLVLQHGFTDSLESWYEFGYVSALKYDYKLILLDMGQLNTADELHPHHEFRGSRLFLNSRETDFA